MHIKKATLQVVFLAILLSVVALVCMSINESYVALPIFLCVIIFVSLWMALYERDQKIPFFDIGIFCALATLIYTVYPLVQFWIADMQFGVFSDNRLQQYNITPMQLGVFHFRHVIYLLSFAVFYLVFRSKSVINVGKVQMPSRFVQQIIIGFFIFLAIYFIALQALTGVKYALSYSLAEHQEQFAAFFTLPLIVLQFSSKLVGIYFLCKIALVFLVVSRCRQKKWRFILLFWVVAEIVQMCIFKGGRTGLILFLMTIVLFYHRMIKPLTTKILLSLGTAILAFFIFLGVYRTYHDVGLVQVDMSKVTTDVVDRSNEFQALLGTSYDVYQRKINGTVFPWYLYINDFIEIFPPQQLVPFEKISAAEWYLRELGISGSGQGLMWGVISQSIIGWDWLELFLRGALLGYILAMFHRWYVRNQSGFFATIFYVFLSVKIYYTFRSTTFSFLSNIVWEIIPFYIILRIGSSLLPRKKIITGVQG